MASKRSCINRVCLFWTRVLVRLIQFCSSLVAFITLSTAGVTYHDTVGGQKVPVVVSNNALNFARIVNFLAFVYAFAFLIFIEWLRLCMHPMHYCEKVLDLIIMVSLTVATLILLLSRITLQCRRGFGRFMHCEELYVAIAMSFLSMLAFLCIVLLARHDETGERRYSNSGAQRQSEGHDDRASETYSRYGSPRAGATPVPVVTAS